MINSVAIGVAFSIVWTIAMLIALGGIVILFIAVWRFVKAHESIARSLQLLALSIDRDKADSEKEPDVKDI